MSRLIYGILLIVMSLATLVMAILSFSNKDMLNYIFPMLIACAFLLGRSLSFFDKGIEDKEIREARLKVMHDYTESVLFIINRVPKIEDDDYMRALKLYSDAVKKNIDRDMANLKIDPIKSDGVPGVCKMKDNIDTAESLLKDKDGSDV